MCSISPPYSNQVFMVYWCKPRYVNFRQLSFYHFKCVIVIVIVKQISDSKLFKHQLQFAQFCTFTKIIVKKKCHMYDTCKKKTKKSKTTSLCWFYYFTQNPQVLAFLTPSKLCGCVDFNLCVFRCVLWHKNFPTKTPKFCIYWFNKKREVILRLYNKYKHLLLQLF